MKKGRGWRILGYILMVLGIAGVVTFSLANSAMIVAMGIRTLETMMVVAYIAAGVGVGVVAAGAVPAIVESVRKRNGALQLESTRREDMKQFSEYAKDSLNPEKTRIRFEQLRRNNPALSPLVERCLVQMDTIDSYQARHKSLLDANEAIYLEDTIDVIDNCERRMCRNFRNIINCCILVENTGEGEEALDRDIVESSLADNRDELESVNTLLKYSVAYINNYNRNGVSDRSELDAWLKVMKSSMGGKNETN